MPIACPNVPVFALRVEIKLNWRGYEIAKVFLLYSRQCKSPAT